MLRSCFGGCGEWEFAPRHARGTVVRVRLRRVHARLPGSLGSLPLMARLTEHGLRRSVGVPGLFATAYGNVGSSIYYALGLVAAHALGLTPLVFVFAGGLFALTAKTYAEGAAMFPEAGGSSSFARHAFNDVVSFFAGWALSLDYILTIAISAFFVPHYLSAFPGLHALDHNPGRHRRRADRRGRCSPG